MSFPTYTAKSPRAPIPKNFFERLPVTIDIKSIPPLFKISRKLSQSLEIITIFEYYFQAAINISHYKFGNFVVLFLIFTEAKSNNVF